MSALVVNVKLADGTADPVINVPFFIHQPSSVWLVAGASLDLFLVRTTDGQPSGARHHLARVAPSEAIFGFDCAVQDEFRILAVPGVGCRLGRVTIEGLQEHPKLGHRALVILERWILHLAQAVATSGAPASFVPLDPGAEIFVDEEPRAALPVDGVAWVEHERGHSRFLGLSELDPLSPADGLIPVTNYTWIEPQPGTRLQCVDPAGLYGFQPFWDGLQRFHHLAIRCLLRNLDRVEQRELQRLKRQAEADATRIETALVGLASPLEQVRYVRSAASSNSALLAAAQAVGKAMGIHIRPHPEVARGLQSGNPVAMIAKASNVRLRRVMLKGRWWSHDSGPILAFRDSDNSPVALLPAGRRRYELFDPASGEATRLNEKMAMGLNGFAYIFYRPFPPVALTALRLLSFGTAQAHSDIWMIVLMGIVSGMLAVIAPITTGIIFDSVIPGAQRTQLITLTLFLLVSAFSAALFNITRSFATLRLQSKMAASIQAAVWDRLLALPVPFFRDYSSGDLANRSMGINQMHAILTGSTLSSILTGVFSIFSFGLLFYYSVRLALLATLLTGTTVMVTTAAGYLQVRRQREISRIRGRLSGMVLQFIHGISKFRVSGTEHRAFVAWAGEFARQKELAVKARVISNRLAAFTATFPIICTAIIFYYSAQLQSASGDSFTTGDFLAFLAAFMQFMMATLQLSSSAVSVLGIVPLYERARPILQTLPEVDEAKANPGDLRGEIELNHISFRYRPDTPLILHDVSISILPGQFVAIVGPSGCGKSTMLRLLLGFERPESGAIYYDRQDLAGLDLQAVRQQMGVVLQHSKLFSGSMFSNIVGSAPLTENDAWEAARLSGLDRDIQNMPMGMHTAISDGGGGLSGGQRQRLLIARAIVRKPRIILFDEATSALDNRTQAIVSKSLEGLQATRIVIAHRLSTIVNADRIFVLDRGRVVQQGAYGELIRTAGPFLELARRQIV
jgi:NHLM bacteriocin system ABC transporter ATP-binding protein